MTLEEVAKLEYVTIRGLGGGRVPMEVHKVTGRSVWLRGTSTHRLYIYRFTAFWALEPRPTSADAVRKGEYE